MKHLHCLLAALLCLLAAAPLAGATASAPTTCRGAEIERIADLRLPGPSGRFDYQTVNAASGMLYVNQMGAGRTLVFDLHSRRLVGQAHGLGTPTGITLAADRDRMFISDPGDLLDRAWGDGAVVVVDTRTLAVVRRLRADGFPDGSAWVPGLQRLFVSNERGGIETVIGGHPLRVLRRIHLGGTAGNSAWDAAGDRVLVNLQDRRSIAVLDPAAMRVVQRVALPDTCQHNHGMLVDDADALAFVACDGNARLLVLRLPSLQTLAVHRLGREPDVLKLDAARHRLWVASESGTVSVFAVDHHGASPLWRGYLGPDAHSVAIDPATGEAWFPLADDHGHPVMRIVALHEARHGAGPSAGCSLPARPTQPALRHPA